jgi:ubiquinone/menaquinone biosynthesis C-methylase UbiE
MRLEFVAADAERTLPFPDGSFDIVFCNDAINHFGNRLAVLGEWRRVLRIGGRCLFSDPVVITRLVSNAELAERSLIGFFMFSVPGANDSLLQEAGFRVERVADSTENVARVARRWRQARESRRTALVSMESEVKYDAIQQFLATVHILAQERRLSRFVYVGARA